MIKSVSPIMLGMHSINVPKKQNIANNFQQTQTCFELGCKVPFFRYHPVFKGSNYFAVNSKRKCKDYGDKLYIGSYPAPSRASEKYSVDRKKSYEKCGFERGCFYV